MKLRLDIINVLLVIIVVVLLSSVRVIAWGAIVSAVA